MKNYKFCPNCGKKVEEGWKVCSLCTTNIEITDEEYVEKYPQQNEPQTPKTNNKMLVICIVGLCFIILMMALAITVSNFAVDSESPYTPPVDPPQTHPLEPVDPPYVPPEPTYQDAEFISWLMDSNKEITNINDLIYSSLVNEYWYTLELYSEELEDLIDDELKSECLAFTLSYSYDDIRDEYYEHLYDLSWASFYTKNAANDMQNEWYSSATDNFNEATDYTEQATVHLNAVTDMIEDLT